jgi:hypothetical protein
MCNSSDRKDCRFSSIANMIEWLLEDNTAINYSFSLNSVINPSFNNLFGRKDNFYSATSGISVRF